MPAPRLHDVPPVGADPFVATLLGDDATPILQVALEAVGATLRSAMPRQTTYHPGRSLTVRYDASVVLADGTETRESLVAVAGDRLPSDAATLSDGEHEVAVWAVPNDPSLPGLARALDPASVRALLADLGAPVKNARCYLRAYRPGRRAVVEVVASGARLFLKVVKPRNAEALHRRHALLAGTVPVPASLGWSEELGIVALQAVDGITLRKALDNDCGLPSAQALVALLDALPQPETPAERRPWGTERFATLIGACVPDLSARLDALMGELVDAERRAATEPLVPTHGDFHEAQLLVDRGRITGLLDVDTFGWGSRVDELATMIGHLSVYARISRRRNAIERYAAELLAVFDRLVDPVALREATAAVTLGLATGPFRVLDRGWPEATRRRVALAEEWLASARRVETRVAAR